jgi:hypothetical protein
VAELILGGKFLDRNFREEYRLIFLIELTGSWKVIFSQLSIGVIGLKNPIRKEVIKRLRL